MPRRGSRRDSSRRSSRRRRSSSASTSGTSIWRARSDRRTGSRRFSSASDGPATRSSGVPKGRLFPVSRDDLVECTALLRSVRQGELDAIVTQDAPLDVLTQQIVAETASRAVRRGRTVRRWCGAPGRSAISSRRDFDAVVAMAADGFATRARPPKRAHPPRRSAWAASRPARRADARDHVGRRDSGGRRLPRDPRSGRHVHRHAERGLRDREHGRATSFSSGMRRGGCCRSVPAPCASPTRKARRRTFRSGWARRRRGATSCRARSAICGGISRSG